jgi:phosphatidylglycerol:prolipoprotein diacylglycerol transferase
MDLGIWIIISALVGAKLLLLIVDYRQFLDNPGSLMDLLRSGGVFYGGLIAAVTVALFYIWRHRMPMWTTTDVFAPGIALGHVVGRLGCLLAGCCFGRQTTVPWAISFHDPQAFAVAGTPLGVPLHPTQLYEAGAEALILVFLLAFERRGRQFPGRTFWTYMLRNGVPGSSSSSTAAIRAGRLRRAVDVPVRVGHPRAAVGRHAALLSRRPDPPTSAAAAQRIAA